MQHLELRWMENGDLKQRRYEDCDLYDILEDVFLCMYMKHSMVRLLVCDENGRVDENSIRLMTRPGDIRKYLQDVLRSAQYIGEGSLKCSHTQVPEI